MLYYVGNIESPARAKSPCFQEATPVDLCFISLSFRIAELLQRKHFNNLKDTCIEIIIGAQLPKYFRSKFESCGTTNELLSTLRFSPYWNWIDIRLMEKVSCICDEAKELLERYKDKLYPLKLVDLLSFLPTVEKDNESHYKIMSVKIQKKINDVLVKDFFFHRRFLEIEILHLKGGALVLKHIKKEPFHITWLIPIGQCLDALKSAKENVEKFHEISLTFIHIEPYEAIYQVHM